MSFAGVVESQFEKEDGIVYFDSAGRSVLPKSVETVGVDALKRKSTPWNGICTESDGFKVRQLFAELINCESDCIAIGPSTGFAMTVAAKNIVRMGVLHVGTSVLLIEKDAGSAVYPWQDACNQTHATLRIVEDPIHSNDEISWADAIIEQLDENVAVIVLPVVHWCDGALIGLEKIVDFLAEIPEENRPLLVADGTQSVGVMPFDVQEIKPTFMACSGHKWLNGHYGLSLMYLDPSLHDLWEPLDQHERSRAGSDKPAWDEVGYMNNTTGYPEAFLPGARRLDSGGHPNPVAIPMLKEALSLTLKWNPADISAHLRTLTDTLAEKLTTALGTQVVHIRPQYKRCGHILGVRLHKELTTGVATPPTTSGDNNSTAGNAAQQNQLYNVSSLGAELKQYGVYVSIRGGVMRISPYIHNTLADVNKFCTVFIQLVVNRMLKHSTTVPLSVVNHAVANLPPPCVALHEYGSTNGGGSGGSGGQALTRRLSVNRMKTGTAAVATGSTENNSETGSVSTTMTYEQRLKSGSFDSTNSSISGVFNKSNYDSQRDHRASPNFILPPPSMKRRGSAGQLITPPLTTMPVEKIRILLTGASGWLGQVITQSVVEKALSEHYELYAGYHNSVPDWIVEEQRVSFDLTDRQSVVDAITRIRPQVIIHTAAMSSPVACHKNATAAVEINTPEYLIQTVREIMPDSLFIFTSTDMVYDGQSPPYSVVGATKPVNTYGDTKLAFESLVTTLKHGVVLRLSNMIGRNFIYRNAGCKFTQFLSEACAKREFISLKTDEIRSFVHVDDVVAIVLKAIKTHTVGMVPTGTAVGANCGALSRPSITPRGSFTGTYGLTNGGADGTGNSATTIATGTALSCTGCTRKVFNVGGPSGLSRMQLASIVAAAMGVQLKIVHTQSVPLFPVEDKVWEVSVFASEHVAAVAVAAVAQPTLPADVAPVSAPDTQAEADSTVTTGTVPPSPPPPSSASALPPTGGGKHATLRSPVDISMNSVMTESHFQMKFSDIDRVMKSCL